MLPPIKMKVPKHFWIILVGSLLLPWIGSLWYFEVDVTNLALLLCAGLLAGLMVLLFLRALNTHQETMRPGCLLSFGLLLVSGLLGLAGYLARLTGLPWEGVAALALFLFSLILVAGFPCTGLGIYEAYYYQEHLARKLYRDLGFAHDTNRIPGGSKELFISHLQPGGQFAEAGFQPGDVVLDRHSFTGFFMKLEKARGGDPITITVARSLHAIAYADRTPLPERPTAALTVKVPARETSERLERDLGFRCELDFFKLAGDWVGVLIVRDVQPGGLFHRAGFQERDILLDLEVGGAPRFFEKLEQARGREVSLSVVPWIDPLDVAERPLRELILEVPSTSLAREESQSPSPRRRLSDLERDLGFTEGWEWLPHKGVWHGAPTLENLHPCGVMARAGFQEKDILLEGFGYDRRWAKARGGESITVRVASCVDVPALHERPRRVLALRVPARRLEKGM